jgi:hypothetical protein
MEGFNMKLFTKSDIQRRRDRFELELCVYGGFTYNAGKLGLDQPPYMPELRALYMAVRETAKGGFGKGETVNHQWPLCVGKARRVMSTLEQRRAGHDQEIT